MAPEFPSSKMWEAPTAFAAAVLSVTSRVRDYAGGQRPLKRQKPRGRAIAAPAWLVSVCVMSADAATKGHKEINRGSRKQKSMPHITRMP